MNAPAQVTTAPISEYARPIPLSGVQVPLEPTEAMWGGLARDIIMWLECYQRPSGRLLHYHLENCGTEIPEWLAREIPDTDTVPSKGTIATCVYKAMLAERP